MHSNKAVVSRRKTCSANFFSCCLWPRNRSRGEGGGMNSTVAYKTAVCAQYEILLKECEGALEAWDERREQIAQSHLSEKEVGDELLRLQTDCAKAYTVMCKHVSKCAICRFFLRSSAEESEYDWYEKSKDARLRTPTPFKKGTLMPLEHRLGFHQLGRRLPSCPWRITELGQN